MNLLDVKNLSIDFETARGRLRAVDRLSFQLSEGEALGIVGESGCGKSVTSLALMRLLSENASVSADVLKFQGQDLLSLSEKKMQSIRGREISMIFQNPLSSLNPSFTVGYQLVETLKAHQDQPQNKKQNIQQALELLRSVGIPDPARRLDSYPHQLSGGMCQRVMIAMAIACRPKLLIADEPTTALDVTIQAQIMDLLLSLKEKTGMGLILITHDLGLVSKAVSRVLVMYAGQAVEEGRVREILSRPEHPYTHGLLNCLPAHAEESAHRSRLPTITGVVPHLIEPMNGCRFEPRCTKAQDQCNKVQPELYPGKTSHKVRCFYPIQQGSLK